LLYELAEGEQLFHAPHDCVGTGHIILHAEAMSQWLKTVATIETRNEEFYRLFRQALEDMAALRLPIRETNHTVFIPAAPGIPDALLGWLREHGLEGFRRFGHVSRWLAGEEAQGALRASGLRLQCLAPHGGGFCVLGKPERARELRAKAGALFVRVNEAFWDEELGFYAYALDGDKNKVLTVASNPGHCLWSGIVPRERARRVVDRLIAPDM
jgi:hypothetical protein